MGGLGDRLHSAPFVRLLIPFICGIILSEWILPPKSLLYYLIPVAFTLLLFLYRHTTYKNDFVTGLCIALIFISLGFSISLNNRYIPNKLSSGRYYAVLDEYPIEKGKSYRAEIRLVDSKIKILAYFEKSNEIISAEPGTLLFFEGCPELIVNQGNPFEFDYKAFSLRKRIGHRIYLNRDAYSLFKKIKMPSLQNRALLLREKLLRILSDHGVRGETFRVISAITLGARENLDPETTQSFTRTGTLHVLAVSGGNVAVIFLMLNFLFKYLKRNKYGIILHTLIILSGIWGYALITGLSPSVLRAAMMFTFVVIGNNSTSKANIYNSLAASAFILMCFNPSLLFDVGFQLSYAAVAAIVFLHPYFYKAFYFRFFIFNWLWLLFSVSLAAQIGTLPFSLLYFHQFPSYFWLSNMIVVPLVSVLIYLTVLVIVLVPFFPVIGTLTSHLLSWIGNQMMIFLQHVEKLPFAVFENIYPTVPQIILTILIVITASLFFRNKKTVYALISISILLLVLLLNTISLNTKLSRKEILVFNIPGKTLLAFTTGSETIWMTGEKPEDLKKLDYFIKPYTGNRRIKNHREIYLSDTANYSDVNLVKVKNFINYQGLKIFIKDKNSLNPDSLEIFPKTDIVLIIEKDDKNSDDLRDKFPEVLKISTQPPFIHETGKIYWNNLTRQAGHYKSMHSGAIMVTILKNRGKNKLLFRTNYFQDSNFVLDRITQ